jgi:nucleoside-diphosphate-sugar epimerase
MRVLITGNAGFVGGHFYRWLRDYGHDVYGCDIRAAYPRDCVDMFRSNEGQSMDLVIHCAATIPSITVRHANKLKVAHDLTLDAEMFQWAQRVQPGKLVYLSSSAAYPAYLQVMPTTAVGHKLVEDDIDLDDICTPDQMYGVTKLVGEMQARSYRELGGDVLVVRPQSGYGADQSTDYPFRAMLERARAKADPFEVYGTGHQVRDFIHIHDVVGAVMALVESDVTGPINIGTGVPTSMLTLARFMTNAAGYEPDIVTRRDMPIGTPWRCADVTMLHQFYVPWIQLTDVIEEALR